MRAILVIDIKEDADTKTLRANYEVYGDIRIKPYYQFGEGVELKPMPSKRKSMVEWLHKDTQSYESTSTMWTHEISDYDKGWNDCVDFLEGGEQ